jgi:hypothetical protein
VKIYWQELFGVKIYISESSQNAVKMPPFCPFVAGRYEQNNSRTAELSFQHDVKEFTTYCWAFPIPNETAQFERLIYVEM